MKKRVLIYLSIIFIFLTTIIILSLYNKHKENDIKFPIDLVYLWVDGNDPQWLEKKLYWQEKLGITDRYAVSEARFRDREELKHSLRSVEQYIPWIRKIFIVTDNQVPEWLNTKHPKIKIIDHKDILPNDILPVFNSDAIEIGIANIEDLSEHFIYLNDDVFVNKKLTPDFFFSKDGKPIFYFDFKMSLWRGKIAREHPNETWIKMDNNLLKLKKEKNIKGFNLTSTHTMTAYTKTDFLNIIQKLNKEIRQTTFSKFRDIANIGVLRLIADIMFDENKIILKDSTFIDTKFGEGPAGILVYRNIDDINKLNPCLFCLNDDPYLTTEESQAHTSFLRKRFPKKSSFEK